MNRNFQLFCDLDGCLVDFEKGIVETGNELIDIYKPNFAPNQNESDFDNKSEYKFYKYIKSVYSQFNGFKDHYTFSDFERRTKGDRAFRDLMYWYVSNNMDWWIKLEWTPDGKDLWNSIKQHDPFILSCPIGPKSEVGKKIWCIHNLQLENNKIFIMPDKAISGLNAIPILIDDREKYIVEIESVGGIGILHKTGQTEKTLEKLNKIINNIKGYYEQKI